jgi:predicted Fe-Mo cluster-binding NifX family protein
MKTPSLLSGGTRAFLLLSVLVSGTSLIVTACETNGPQTTIRSDSSTVTKMKRGFVSGEVLVKFKPSVSQERIDAILKECGTERIAVLKDLGVQHVRIVNKEAVERVVMRLSAFQEVEYAEPNLLSHTEQ